MKVNANKINKVYENLFNKSQIDKFLNQRNKDNEVVYVIPFYLEDLGTANTTEAGIVGNEFEINDFTSYAKLLTGLDNVIAKWDEAYNVYIDEEANKDLPDIEKYITKEYKAGRVIKCISYQDATGSNTIPSPVDSSFKQIEINENIIVKTTEKLKISDIIKVYLIPQKNKWRWLYLADMTEYYDKDNKYIGAEFHLSSVNSIYSQSGGAIEQFIQKSAPGEGYAFPKWNAETKQIEMDEERAKDLPVQAVQREYSGAATFNTIYCYGRPTEQEVLPDGIIKNKFNPKIKASRLLLPYRVQTPKISPINTKPSSETDYYLAVEANPTMNKYYSNWKEQFQANYDLNLRKQYEGVLELPKESELEKTNPIDNGTHRYILWDNDFQVRFTNKEFNTETNKLTNEKIVLNGSYRISEILAHNSFITNHMITLPMNAETNVTWNLRDIPIIGGFLNTITLGIPIGWTNTNARVKQGTVMLLTPANLVKYGNQLIPGQDKSLIPFDLLQENTADLIQHSGIAGMGSSIKLLLTDEFIKNGKRYNTVQLGQPLEDGTILKWDGSCKPVSPTNTSGYVIDVLIDRTISKTNCRTVFTSSQYEVFQSTYKTKSKFTNEIRDWTNQIKFSSWKTDNGTIRFPGIIQQPTPPQVETPLIELSKWKDNDITIQFTDDIVSKSNSQYWRDNSTFGNLIAGTKTFRTWRGSYNVEEILNTYYDITPKTIDTFEWDYSKYAPNINQLSFLYDYLTFQGFKTENTYRVNISDLIGGVREFKITNDIVTEFIYKWKYWSGGKSGTYYEQQRKSVYKCNLKIEIDALTKPNVIIFNIVEIDKSYSPTAKVNSGDPGTINGSYGYLDTVGVAIKGLNILNDNSSKEYSYNEILNNNYIFTNGINNYSGTPFVQRDNIRTIINGRMLSSIFIVPKIYQTNNKNAKIKSEWEPNSLK